MHYLTTLSLLVCLSSPALTHAQAAPVPADTTAPAAPLTTYGFVDGYYGYDFDHGGSTQRPSFLFSHNQQNEFAINNALLGVRYDDGRVRGTVALHAGTYVTANYANEDVTMRHIYEAYAGFRPFKKTWLDVGIFSAHIGFETALSKDNWNLTRTLAAENSPYYETGARFTYEASPKLTLAGFVLNGWQNIRDNNQGKALGTQVQWKPSAKVLVNSSTFYGNEQPQDSLRRRRYYHNFYITYAATTRLSVAGEFDLGTQQSIGQRGYDTWHAGNLFIKYQLSTRYSATLRGEYYKAERGVIISSFRPRTADVDFLAGGPALNFDYAPTSHVLVRLEGRYLRAQNAIFQHENGFSRNYGNLTSSVALSF